MSDDAAQDISQHWKGDRIVLSYFIAVTGSYCTIQLMEQWRRVEEAKMKRLLLLLSSVALGGCGIWCMHFTGMTAIELRLEDGSLLEIDYEFGYTTLSMLFAIVGVLIGLAVASSDPYFVEMQAERRKEMLSTKLKKMKMSAVVKKSSVTKRIKLIALFSRLWLILLGGAFAALGVLGMHYLGMMAQRTNADMSFDASVVTLSVIIAFVTANAAFWILFRALTFMPNSEALRLGSALIMGIAVCATHYSGMGAASYTTSAEDYAKTTRFLLDGKSAAEAASNGALLICYWFASFSVVRSTRMTETSAARGGHTVTGNPSGVSNGPERSSFHNAPDDASRGGGSRKILVAAALTTPEAQV